MTSLLPNWASAFSLESPMPPPRQLPPNSTTPPATPPLRQSTAHNTSEFIMSALGFICFYCLCCGDLFFRFMAGTQGGRELVGSGEWGPGARGHAHRLILGRPMLCNIVAASPPSSPVRVPESV
ncbi:GD13496 [Drosophila simulans]|uniref:GD13496 n=1 Tax=Drosophila simulans TaxID=7240 RepID=B4QLX0_DROSI|nr:GD13496 [Drosophila simulans]